MFVFHYITVYTVIAVTVETRAASPPNARRVRIIAANYIGLDCFPLIIGTNIIIKNIFLRNTLLLLNAKQHNQLFESRSGPARGKKKTGKIIRRPAARASVRASSKLVL